MRSQLLLVQVAILRAGLVLAQDDLGKLPVLGWNSWNAFRCDISEEKVLTAANAIIELGLKDVGYEYVNLDDCYSIQGKRDENDRMIPDPKKFPNGIRAVADKVHDLGLKIGIYSSAGTETCAGYPASLEKEEIDAATFAEWGMDYLKYDNCGVPEEWVDEYNFCVPDQDNEANPNGTCPGLDKPAPEGYDWGTSKSAERYRRMRDALEEQDRPILLSLCNWGHADVISWAKGVGPSWRMSGDIFPNWPRVAQILNLNSFWLHGVDFYGRNDPDMLEVGNGDLTIQEQRTHFALWAAMKSPLLIGTALDQLDEEKLNILKNKVLLAFNQDDETGRPAYPYKWGYNPDHTFDAEHPAEYWSGPFKHGTLVLMSNSEDQTAMRTAVWSEIPELRERKRYAQRQNRFQVTDGWTGEDLGCVEGEYTVELERHDTAVLHVGGPC